ncbi:MFS transporter [Streptomyces nogalater]
MLSGVSAAANTLGALVALRLALGVAGALLLPASLAVITNAYSNPADRARAVGNWAAITGLALAAPPGRRRAHRHRRLARDLPHQRAAGAGQFPDHHASGPGDGHQAAQRPRRHRPGQRGRRPGRPVVRADRGPGQGLGATAVVATIVLAAVAAAVFVAAESRAGDAAMLPLRMFRSRGFSAALTSGLLANFGLSGLLFVLSLFFQESRGYSSFSAGLAFLPLTLPTAFNPIYTGRLVGRIGPRRPATIGFVLMGVGALLQAPFTGDSALALTATVIGLLAFGFGVSFALPALVAGMASSVPPELAGIGAGALNSARQVGASLGVAVLGVVLNLSATNAGGTRWALVVGGLTLLLGALITVSGLRGRTAS